MGLGSGSLCPKRVKKGVLLVFVHESFVDWFANCDCITNTNHDYCHREGKGCIGFSPQLDCSWVFPQFFQGQVGAG